MRAIYEPKGKAKEYCELALNLYTGCPHGCSYCYVPRIMRKSRDEFFFAQPRLDVITQLKKEVHKYKGKTVFLCFSCDPYPYKHNPFTTIALEILLSNGVNVEILTKSGMISMQDEVLFKVYKEQVNYGATLTFISSEMSKKYEPFAADPEDRINALFIAHHSGIRTWVSLEPVINTAQTLYLIDETYPFVDEYRVGKLNYSSIGIYADATWTSFLIMARERFKQYGKKYLVKESLKPYLKEAK
jgi:DNA repair photolyase